MGSRNEYSHVACMHSTATQATRVVARAQLRRVLNPIYLLNVLIHDTLDMEYGMANKYLKRDTLKFIWRWTNIKNQFASREYTNQSQSHYNAKWIRSIDTFEFYNSESSVDLIFAWKINSANSTDDVKGLCEMNHRIDHFNSLQTNHKSKCFFHCNCHRRLSRRNRMLHSIVTIHHVRYEKRLILTHAVLSYISAG